MYLYSSFLSFLKQKVSIRKQWQLGANFNQKSTKLKELNLKEELKDATQLDNIISEWLQEVERFGLQDQLIKAKAGLRNS